MRVNTPLRVKDPERQVPAASRCRRTSSRAADEQGHAHNEKRRPQHRVLVSGTTETQGRAGMKTKSAGTVARLTPLTPRTGERPKSCSGRFPRQISAIASSSCSRSSGAATHRSSSHSPAATLQRRLSRQPPTKSTPSSDGDELRWPPPQSSSPPLPPWLPCSLRSTHTPDGQSETCRTSRFLSTIAQTSDTAK